MSIRNLDRLLAPGSVALVGASSSAGSIGGKIASNLLEPRFEGQLFFVNPKHREIAGEPCYPNLSALPKPPDLVIIATPPATIPGLINEAGRIGTRAAVVITAGIGLHRQAMLDAARKRTLRIMGPNCLGLLLPTLSLNASFAHRPAPKGDLAFLSQSGALVTAVIDWAADRNVGFSHVLSLGEMADVDFGDALDYLAGDAKSRAILIYMEALTSARKFISAARRAARSKPVIVVKSGRHASGARAALSHTGALAGSDAAYDAAFRRAGLVRVNTLPDLFAAAEILSRRVPLAGEDLTVVTNGGGAGVLAVDELQDAGGTLAQLSNDLVSRLDAVLPPFWSRGNPVDIIGDAGPERYRAAMEQILADEGTNAVLVMQCPTALASAGDNAQAVIDTYKKFGDGSTARKPLLTCWLGDGAAREAREMFAAARIPTFETPSDAITGYMQLVRHSRSQIELMRAPSARAPEGPQPGEGAQPLVRDALARGRRVLTPVETKALLSAAGIPVAETRVARDPAEVEAIAAELLKTSKALAVKILSDDITHKSDVGGVRLRLNSPALARVAAEETLAQVSAVRPDARIDGFMVEAMVTRPDAYEVIVGMSEDATFGPMLLFGAGGTAVEIVADRALALPPLDAVLAERMIAETRISKLLAGFRDRPPVDRKALVDTMVRISNLIICHPEIRELEINPLLVDARGVIAVDARTRLDDPAVRPRQPLAIKPYPNAWRTTFELPLLGTVRVRPVRPDDELLYHDFFAQLSPDDVRLRFFTSRVHLSHKFLARLTQIDYAREMAFVALSADGSELYGVVRLALDPNCTVGEYGIIIRSDLKGRGLGWRLMQHLIDYARSEGVAEIEGVVLSENTAMIDMVRRLGFGVSTHPDHAKAVLVRLDLRRGRSDPAFVQGAA